MQWYIEAMKKCVVLRGRARRKEYWMFNLFYMIGVVILSDFTLYSDFMLTIFVIYVLAHILPVQLLCLHPGFRNHYLMEH